MRVLIGSTGFVGTTLGEQVHFDAAVHRPNLEEIRGLSADLVVCAGAPAAKWLINQDPAADRANISRLVGVLDTVTAQRFLLISTIDVYPSPNGATESVAADTDQAQAYGRHRAQLESEIRNRFPQALIVRLPALYGRRLRKNLVFDLLQGRQDQYASVNPDSTFQFFDVARTWEIAQAAQEAGLAVLNVATEPVTARQVADVFDVRLNDRDKPAVSYDMRTEHASLLGRGNGPYLFSAEDALAGIAALRASWTGPVR